MHNMGFICDGWQVHNKAERARKRGGDETQPGGSRDSIQEPSLDLYSLGDQGGVTSGLNLSGVHESGGVGGGGAGAVGRGEGSPGGRESGSGSGRGGVNEGGNGDGGAFGNWCDAGAWTLVADEVYIYIYRFNINKNVGVYTYTIYIIILLYYIYMCICKSRFVG